MSLTFMAFVFFAGIATGGTCIALFVALGLRFPRWLGTAHGLGGLAALSVLFAANLRNPAALSSAWWALGVMVAAFSGGLLLFRTLFPQRPPLALVALHGSLALTGLYLLYQAALAST